jgi:hypothetical protein
MTKQIDCGNQAGDRPAQFEKLEFGEGYDSIVSDYRKTLHRLKDALVFKGLSLSEAYIEGRARIAVQFRSGPIFETKRGSFYAVWNHDRKICKKLTGGFSGSVEEIQTINSHDSICADQDVMFVGNIEPVDTVKLIPSHLERLYFIKDKALDLGVGAGSCFLSYEGRFRVLPRVAERELSPSIDGPAIGIDQCTISVIQGRAKIVDGVTNDSGRVPWDAATDRSLVPTIRIWLGAEGLDVFCDVGPNNHFELLDVMIGPFYF